MILALDPGTFRSALVLVNEEGLVATAWLEDNDRIRQLLLIGHPDVAESTLVIEQIESFGKRVGREVFETVRWAGRFEEAWFGAQAAPCKMVSRREVKLHLCGHTKVKDKDIRQALINRYGGSKAAAIGNRANPGHLYGLRADMWSALAVGVTYYDRVQQEARTA